MFGTLRDIMVDLNFDFAHGVTATITRPGETPVPTKVIPTISLFEDQPVGSEFSSVEPRRVYAVRRSEFPILERGTIINAPEKQGGAAQDWQVDKIESTTDHYFLAAVIAKTGL